MRKNLLSVGFVALAAVGSLVLAEERPAASPDKADAPTATKLPLSQPALANEPAGEGRIVVAGQGGRVHEVYAQAGQQVRQGQILVKTLLKTASVAQQQLSRRLSQQQLAYAALRAQQPAADPAALAEARQQLDATRQQLARLVPMLSFGFITAPADGLVTQALTRPGDQLTPTSAVVRLADLPRPDTTRLLTSVD